MNEKQYKIIFKTAIAGLVIGSWGMAERLIFGLSPVAFGSHIPWGLWVALYIFFLGLSAGAFLITILTYVFRIKKFESIGKLSAFTVLAALLCEGFFIILDLGSMHRVYRFLVTPSFTSIMTWMFIFFSAMGIIYLIKTYLLIKEDLIRLGNDETLRWQKWYRRLAFNRTEFDDAERSKTDDHIHKLAIISLPVGILFYGANGAFFAILLNRPIWNSAMTPLLFIVAALLSGGALIVFLTHIFHRDNEVVLLLGRIILGLLGIFLLMEFLQLFVGYYAGSIHIAESINLIIFGPYWWTFWIVHLVFGSLIPLYLLIKGRDKADSIAIACALIVVSFISVRLNFIVPDQAVYKLEGLGEAFQHMRLSAEYFPNLNEWLVSIWVVSLGVLFFLAGTKYLPVISSEIEMEKK
jgi:molybdopterin-containing oxidoreductase family membrane subunit